MKQGFLFLFLEYNVNMDRKERDEELKKIRDEVLRCRKCLLYKTRTLPVVGQGNHQAKIMFIGEAPGYNEDKTGRPFCGRAGAVLNELLKSINLTREDVYITNLLKCRPPGNRDPEEKEIKIFKSIDILISLVAKNKWAT